MPPIRCCRDCKLRPPDRGCGNHDDCEIYQKEKQKNDKMKQTLRNEKGTYISNSERFANGEFYYRRK